MSTTSFQRFSTATNPGSLETTAPPGTLRKLPPAFCDFFFKLYPDLNFRFLFSQVPPQLGPFLEMCERRAGLIPYDEVVCGEMFERFIAEEVGYSGFMVMLYKHSETDLASLSNVHEVWDEYLIVFLSKEGKLCVFMEEGGIPFDVRWEYTEECFEKVCGLLEGLAEPFPGIG
ncbi:hypothetical protein BJ508DRAFT_323008 [Ascobolus immersus RN42]|uniref:Uncharacterized protein n=1 Tax=Ascobolus immersus RN42 TaxID=1160509 RepID=A0A3N4ILW1_ASCIM|nr:hypothetical protein BJ508DRAFT_323008 [Ascobolus immersus RN42]